VSANVLDFWPCCCAFGSGPRHVVVSPAARTAPSSFRRFLVLAINFRGRCWFEYLHKWHWIYIVYASVYIRRKDCGLGRRTCSSFWSCQQLINLYEVSKCRVAFGPLKPFWKRRFSGGVTGGLAISSRRLSACYVNFKLISIQPYPVPTI